jgi:hypothetical protein
MDMCGHLASKQKALEKLVSPQGQLGEQQELGGLA